MKKRLLIATLALIFMAVCALPASAIENKFGGYWRTRIYSQSDFSGDNTEAQDLTQADTRTRLYYTAVISDDIKFVNKFEMDAVFGDNADNTYGDIGADGKHFEIKNTYVDLKVGNVHTKIGVLGCTIARGFIFNDDFAGFIITPTFGSTPVSFIWIKHTEGGMGLDANDGDIDYYGISPKFSVGDSAEITPYIISVISDTSGLDGTTDNSVYSLGVDFDFKQDKLSAWGTIVMQTGDYTLGVTDYDVSAYLLALGGSYDVGFDLHGQFFYASGDDDSDEDTEEFICLDGVEYKWSKIMGRHTIDNQASNGSPGYEISDIMAFNIGARFNKTDKLTLSADIWYAALAEDDANGEKDLGTEIDLMAKYKFHTNLSIDLLASYLSAGDATGNEDPLEIGTQLVLSF